MAKPSERLAELGITLPPVAKPVGAYVPAVRHGDVLVLSGQVPMRDGRMAYCGKVGGPDGRTLEDAQAAARLCALNAVAVEVDVTFTVAG